eukprot:TRINITY_DN10268_c1_g1_i1.p1 TRINITY_DN10268_c1_g1~~TRINITY_DN10268_c1_g1_i1.p1  ORF type:complete len:418 (+),score=98.07 TRINITY_DN10268_c1_g1_i1:87-1340(+)
MANRACLDGPWWHLVRDVAPASEGQLPSPKCGQPAPAVTELRHFARRYTPGRMPTAWELRKGGRKELLLAANSRGWRRLARDCGFEGMGPWAQLARDLPAELRAHAAVAGCGEVMPNGWALMRPPGARPRSACAYKPALRELCRAQPGGWRGAAGAAGLCAAPPAAPPPPMTPAELAAEAVVIAAARCPGRMPTGWELMQPGPGLRVGAGELRRAVRLRGWAALAAEHELLREGPRRGMPLLSRIERRHAARLWGLTALLRTGTRGSGIAAVLASLQPDPTPAAAAAAAVSAAAAAGAAHRALAAPAAAAAAALHAASAAAVAAADSAAAGAAAAAAGVLAAAAATRQILQSRPSLRSLAAAHRLPSARSLGAVERLPSERSVAAAVPLPAPDASAALRAARTRQPLLRAALASAED